MTEIIYVEESEEFIAERADWLAGAYERERAMIEDIRRQSYIISADPLFFGWQRGDNTEQEWLDAVQAVKDANPYPKQGKSQTA